MSFNALLIDFGASRIKSALFDSDKGSYEVNHVSAGSSFVGPIVPITFFANALLEHLKSSTPNKISAIIMCCEMHGFARSKYLDPGEKEYVSWRYSALNDAEVFDQLNDFDYRELTGLHPRCGLPAVNLLAERGEFKQKRLRDNRISFLPDEICRQLGHSNNIAHVSLAHSSGLYSRNQKPIHNFGLDQFSIPSISTDDLVEIGHVNFEEEKIPCFGGYGDLQASVHGASPTDSDWIINLGTGSQIISLVPTHSQEFEIRKYFNQKEISCVTHIPAGRALNVFANFFREVREEKSVEYFWNKLASVDPRTLANDAPNFDLAVFREAHGFKNGGAICQIYENAFGAKHFFEGLLNSFLEQYLSLLTTENPQKSRNLLIAGSMAKNLPSIKNWFDIYWDSPVRLASGSADPTFDCMASFALKLPR